MQKLITLFLAFSCATSFLRASTTISGQIRTNTTWTKAGSPYLLDGLIEVAPGATLTIDPGVTVVVSDKLSVYGKIQLTGTANDIITFKSKYENPMQLTFTNQNLADTLHVQYCTFNFVKVNSGAINATFDHCIFQNATSLMGGQSDYKSITNCKLVNTEININSTDVFVASKNELVNSNFKTYHLDKTIITDNIISDGMWGLWLSYSGTMVIQNNIIFNTSDVGIYIEEGNIDTDNPITGNIITKNKGVGISIIRNTVGLFTGNTIHDNNIGITYSYYDNARLATFENNCIYNNQINFKYESSDDYNIANNWWGTSDSASIESTIYDDVDDFKVGKLNFMPALQQSHSSCKVYYPTDIPELSQTSSISISPTPFTDNINIKSAKGNGIKAVQLFDITGKQLYHSVFNHASEVIIPAANYIPGIYIYKIVLNDNSISTGRVTK